MKRLAVVMSLVLLACSGIVFLQTNASEETDQGTLTAPGLDSVEAEGAELAHPDALEPPAEKDPAEELPEGAEAQPIGWGTDPCPPTSSCGPDCHPVPPQLGQCTTSNTGENACGWDGTIQNPPEFSCPKHTTIHVRICPCEGDPLPGGGVQVCATQNQSLVCL